MAPNPAVGQLRDTQASPAVDLRKLRRVDHAVPGIVQEPCEPSGNMRGRGR